MSLGFVSASSKRVDTSSPSAAVYAVPQSFFCWCYPTNASANGIVFQYNVSSSGAGQQCVFCNYVGGLSAFSWRFADTVATDYTHSATANINTWHSIGHVFVASDDRDFWVNGSSENATNSKTALSGVDNLMFGARKYSTSTIDSYFDGNIAVPTFWNVALSDDEMAALNNGVHPLLIRPMNIISHWPFTRINGTTKYDDVFQQNQLTQSNSPARFLNPGFITGYSHPPIYYRPRL